MSYTLVSQENFTPEQKSFIEMHRNRSFMEMISRILPECLYCVKDIDSRYIIAGEYGVKATGLSCCNDIIDLFDRNLPCKVAEFAQDFVDEEEKLLSYKDVNRKSSMLNILEYTIGVQAFLTTKHPFVHEPSQSIVGTIGVGYKVNLSYFFTLLPNYLREFGVSGNIENINSTLEIGGVSLTDYEHEVAFLMTMNWKSKQIADFMNKYRPRSVLRTKDTIYKCRNRICNKFDCETWHLRDKLIAIGLHRKMPSSFFDRLIGIGNSPIPS